MKKIREISIAGVMSGIAVVLAMAIRFPVFPAVPFLEYDPADVLIYVCTFMFGIPIGLSMTVVVSVIQGITVSAGSGFVGILSHIFATGGYAVASYGVFCFVKKLLRKSEKTSLKNVAPVVSGSVVGIIVIVILTALWNYIITPLYMDIDRTFFVENYLLYVVLFNIIKAGINGTVSAILYFPLSLSIQKLRGGGHYEE